MSISDNDIDAMSMELENSIPKRLPAIHLAIHSSVQADYCNPIILANEIKRCKKVEAAKVKFANIRGNIIVIATDDKITHDLLSSPWPEGAFQRGVFVRQRRDLSTTSILIRHVDVSIDAASQDIADQLAQQGISEVSRIFRRSDNSPTNILKGKIASKINLTTILSAGS